MQEPIGAEIFIPEVLTEIAFDKSLDIVTASYTLTSPLICDPFDFFYTLSTLDKNIEAKKWSFGNWIIASKCKRCLESHSRCTHLFHPAGWAWEKNLDVTHRYFRRHANRMKGYVGIFGTSRDAPRKPRYVKRRWRETVEKNYCAAVPPSRSLGPRGLRFDRFSAPMLRRCA